MLYALDSNSLSYYLKGKGRVAERVLAEPPANVALPAVALYELEYGAGRVGAPSRLRRRLADVVGNLRILSFGAREARTAARLRLELEKRGRPIGPLDLLIGATALEHGAVLVTHNTREFERIEDLRIEDWY